MRASRLLTVTARATVLIGLALSIHGKSADQKSATSSPRSQFATVSGVRLQFLDWGGHGEALLFLSALGGTAREFQSLAFPLTQHFHVLGLTRRGQGESDKPESGYETSNLADDIRGFLDEQGIPRATLIGYSLAGNEVTEFANRYPERVIKLIYLDAAYDLAENAELGRKAKLDLPSIPGADKPTLELIARSNEYHPQYSLIKVPALGFFVTYDDPPQSPMWNEATRARLKAFWEDYGKAYRREQIDRFQHEMKKGRVVELHHTTHSGFVFEPEQQRILLREMLAFLLNRPQ